MSLNFLEMLPDADDVYTRGFLTLELPRLVRTLNEQDFTCFQVERLRQIVPALSADSLSVSVIVFDAEQVFQRASYVGTHRVAPDIYKKYLEFQHLDKMLGLNRRYRGSAILNTDWLAQDKFGSDAFYDGFMRPTGKFHAAILSYPYPFKTELELRFNFQTQHPNTFGPELTKDVVEYLNLPFFIAWLHRLNAIDDQMMAHWLSLLVERTPFEVMLLRRLVRRGGFSILKAAEALDSEPTEVQNVLTSLCHAANPVGQQDIVGGSSIEWLLNLGNRYDFLHHAGDFVPNNILQRSIASEYANGSLAGYG